MTGVSCMIRRCGANRNQNMSMSSTGTRLFGGKKNYWVNETRNAHASAKGTFFTVFSTVCEIFAAKPRNPAQRCANQLTSGQLQKTRWAKSGKTAQKALFELQSSCSLQLGYAAKIALILTILCRGISRQSVTDCPTVAGGGRAPRGTSGTRRLRRRGSRMSYHPH